MTAREAFEAKVRSPLSTEMPINRCCLCDGCRDALMALAAAWVREVKLAALAEAGQIALDFAPAAMEVGVAHRIDALRERYKKGE